MKIFPMVAIGCYVLALIAGIVALAVNQYDKESGGGKDRLTGDDSPPNIKITPTDGKWGASEELSCGFKDLKLKLCIDGDVTIEADGQTFDSAGDYFDATDECDSVDGACCTYSGKWSDLEDLYCGNDDNSMTGTLWSLLSGKKNSDLGDDPAPSGLQEACDKFSDIKNGANVFFAFTLMSMLVSLAAIAQAFMGCCMKAKKWFVAAGMGVLSLILQIIAVGVWASQGCGGEWNSDIDDAESLGNLSGYTFSLGISSIMAIIGAVFLFFGACVSMFIGCKGSNDEGGYQAFGDESNVV